MHTCCANCAIYPITVMRANAIAVKCLWFNPNIHPYIEYKERLDALRKLQVLWNLDIEFIDNYGLIEFTRNTAGNEENRCEYCYKTRLEEAAKRAVEASFDAFTTSLLVSPYQKFDMIIDIGREMQKKYSVKFYDEDFRTGFNSGRGISKGLGLYQQKYCGCIYSEMQKYLKNKSVSGK